MTLKGHYAPCFKTRASLGAHHENLNEDRLHYQWRRCSPMTLDSGNIWFVRLIPGDPWRVGVKRQWGNQKRRFRTIRLRHLRKWGQHYYTVSAPCRLSTDPKIHDLEWPFYVQFSIFTITNRVSTIWLHTCRRAIHKIFLIWRHQQRCAEADGESAIRRILRLRERIGDLS